MDDATLPSLRRIERIGSFCSLYNYEALSRLLQDSVSEATLDGALLKTILPIKSSSQQFKIALCRSHDNIQFRAREGAKCNLRDVFVKCMP